MTDNPVCMWEICTEDAEKLAEFYQKAFGWDLQPIPQMNYVNVASGDGTDGGISGGIFNRQGEMPSYLTLYVQVDDVDAKAAELKELGANVFVEPTGGEGMPRYAMFLDPQGHTMCIINFPKPPDQ